MAVNSLLASVKKSVSDVGDALKAVRESILDRQVCKSWESGGAAQKMTGASIVGGDVPGSK